MIYESVTVESGTQHFTAAVGGGGANCNYFIYTISNTLISLAAVSAAFSIKKIYWY